MRSNTSTNRFWKPTTRNPEAWAWYTPPEIVKYPVRAWIVSLAMNSTFLTGWPIPMSSCWTPVAAPAAYLVEALQPYRPNVTK